MAEAPRGEAADKAREWPPPPLAWGFDSGRAWPSPVVEPTGAVVVVTRTNMSGLAAAQDVAAQFFAGDVPIGTKLIGLVAVNDQPGRLPRELSSSLALIGGVYPQIWRVPYIAEYRLLTGRPEDECPRTHPTIEDVLDEIRMATFGIPA